MVGASHSFVRPTLLAVTVPNMIATSSLAMQMESKTEVVPSIGTGHDPLPNLVEGLREMTELKCVGLMGHLEELQKEAKRLIARGNDDRDTQGLTAMDEARDLYKTCCMHEERQVSQLHSHLAEV